MAIGTIILPIGMAMLPDGTANNSPPKIQRVKGSVGSSPPYLLTAVFSHSSTQFMDWSLRLPSNYTPGSLIFRLQFYAFNSLPGSIAWMFNYAAVKPGTANSSITAMSMSATYSSNGVEISTATAGDLMEVDWTTVSSDTVSVPGAFLLIRLSRDGTNTVTDTSTADASVVSALLEYTPSS